MRPHSVAIVVDPDFGDAVLALAERVHVWICDTEANRRAVALFPARRSARSGGGDPLASGVTTFRVRDGAPAEAWCRDILWMVDAHHGRYAHEPPWTRITVYGTALTDALRSEFEAFGADRFEESDRGFAVWRDLPRAE